MLVVVSFVSLMVQLYSGAFMEGDKRFAWFYAVINLFTASMLGLGRALGETMAVAMVLSSSGGITFDILTASNPGTIAANIALSFPEAYGANVNVLIATGLMLFAITLIVNSIARFIVNRRAAFSGAN